MNKLFFSLIILTSLNSLHAMDERTLKVGKAVIASVGLVCGAAKLSIRVMDTEKFLNVHQGLIDAEEQYTKSPTQGNLVMRDALQLRYNKTKRNYLFKAALCGALNFGSWITARYLLRYASSGAIPLNNAQEYGSVAAFMTAGALCGTGAFKDVFEQLDKKPTRLPRYMFLGGSILAAGGLYGLYTNK